MKRPLIVYHSPCADGMTAAWVARKKMPDAEFYPAAHQKPLPDLSGRDVIFLDYTPKRDALIKAIGEAKSTRFIDHHEGALAEVKGLTVTEYVFDSKRSGAGLTWDTYFPGTPRPWIVDYVEDRDIWNWKLPHSKELSAVLDVYEQTFEQWDILAQRSPEALLKDGPAFLTYQNSCVRKILPYAREATFEGYNIRVVNSPLFQSELGHALAQGRPFSVVWRQLTDGSYSYSLRSEDNGLDVSVIAKKYGGNGHPHAAGFSSPTLFFP